MVPPINSRFFQNHLEHRPSPTIIITSRLDEFFFRKTNLISSFQPLKTPESYPDKRQVKIQLEQVVNIYPTDSTARLRQLATKTSASKYIDERSSPILRGQKSQLTVYEPIEELNDEIRAARQYVQNLKDESHLKQRKREAETKENNALNRQVNKSHTLDDRLLRTIHGSMAFGCLVAIDKAYNDRAKIERRRILAQDVEETRQEHSFNTAQIQVRISISRENVLDFVLVCSIIMMNV